MAYTHINQVDMAGLMTAPMVLIELVVMRGIYHDQRLNVLIAGAAPSLECGCSCLSSNKRRCQTANSCDG